MYGDYFVVRIYKFKLFVLASYLKIWSSLLTSTIGFNIVTFFFIIKFLLPIYRLLAEYRNL